MNAICCPSGPRTNVRALGPDAVHGSRRRGCKGGAAARDHRSDLAKAMQTHCNGVSSGTSCEIRMRDARRLLAFDNLSLVRNLVTRARVRQVVRSRAAFAARHDTMSSPRAVGVSSGTLADSYIPYFPREGETQHGPERDPQAEDRGVPSTHDQAHQGVRQDRHRPGHDRPGHRRRPRHPQPRDGHLLPRPAGRHPVPRQDDSRDVRGAAEGARLQVPDRRVVLVLPADRRGADAGAGRRGRGRVEDAAGRAAVRVRRPARAAARDAPDDDAVDRAAGAAEGLEVPRVLQLGQVQQDGRLGVRLRGRQRHRREHRRSSRRSSTT